MNLLDEAPIVPGLDMPRLGPAQRERLRQLSQRAGAIVAWDGLGASPREDALVVVLEPANATRVAALIGSLDRTGIVALPFSENPAFDPIKSRLVPHGLIGAEGADAPHQLWWGGIAPLTPQTGMYPRSGTLFVSCYAKGSIPAPTIERFAAHLDLLKLDCIIKAIPTADGVLRAADKIDFISRQLDASARPVFWIEPTAIVRQHPVLPQSLGCDVALLMRGRGEIDTRVLCVRPTPSAQALLEVWHRLSTAYPDLPEALLFDQAWILTAAQRPLETAWLPADYGERDPVIRNATIELPGADDSDEPFDTETTDRRLARALAPEPHLILRGSDWRHRQITVAVSNVRGVSAGVVAAAVDSIATAFAAHSGGFCRLEIVLCASPNDVRLVMALDDDSWVLVHGAEQRFEPDDFARLGEMAASAGAASTMTTERRALCRGDTGMRRPSGSSAPQLRPLRA